MNINTQQEYKSRLGYNDITLNVYSVLTIIHNTRHSELHIQKTWILKKKKNSNTLNKWYKWVTKSLSGHVV